MAFFYYYTVCDAVITVIGVEVASEEKPIEELLKASSDDLVEAGHLHEQHHGGPTLGQIDDMPKSPTEKQALEMAEVAARQAKNWCLQKVLEEKLANEVKLSRQRDAQVFLLGLSPSIVDDLFEDLPASEDSGERATTLFTGPSNVFLTPERRVVTRPTTYSPAARQLQFQTPPDSPREPEEYTQLGPEEKRALRKKQLDQKAMWAVANAPKKNRTV